MLTGKLHHALSRVLEVRADVDAAHVRHALVVHVHAVVVELEGRGAAAVVWGN